MNDHHFSYPAVVPLRGATISGHAVQSPTPHAVQSPTPHAVQSPTPPASSQGARLLQPPVRHTTAAAPAWPRTVASLAA